MKTKRSKIILMDKHGVIENEGNPFEHLRELLKRFSLKIQLIQFLFNAGLSDILVTAFVIL